MRIVTMIKIQVIKKKLHVNQATDFGISNRHNGHK